VEGGRVAGGEEEEKEVGMGGGEERREEKEVGVGAVGMGWLGRVEGMDRR